MKLPLWKIALSSHTLKLIAIITMIIDHVGFFVYPDNDTYRIIGRISFPLFAFLLVYGFEKTKSPINYTLRIVFMFLLIQVPYTWYLSQQQNSVNNNPYFFNIFMNLTLSSLTILLYKYNKIYGVILWGFILAALLYISNTNITINSSSNSYTNPLVIDYGAYGFLLVTLMFLGKELINVHFKNNTLILEKMYISLVLIILVVFNKYVLHDSHLPGNVELYALLDLTLFALYVDVNIRLNKYLKYLLYFIYPVSIGITVLVSSYL